jgi:hypothetical protein
MRVSQAWHPFLRCVAGTFAAMIMPARSTGHALRTGRLLAGIVGYRRKLPEDGGETSRNPRAFACVGNPTSSAKACRPTTTDAIVAPTPGMGAR